MRKLTTLIVLILSMMLLFVLVACDDNSLDGDYTIYIEGIGNKTIQVTKNQILELAKTKGVVYDKDKPCYASDKTDDDNNLIPRTLKGVYLDDILEVYANGAVSGSFSAMAIRGADTYETVLTSNTYNIEQGGSKMILAYEYEGIVLNPNERSGALRAVFPNQPANSWVKKVQRIIFSDASLSPPDAQSISFIELLGDDYNSFKKTRTIGDNEIDYTYYGISVKELLAKKILVADEDDKMYLIAWDFITDGDNQFYRQYTNWKSWEFYQDAYLVYQYQINGGEIVDEDLAPIFEGANIQKGMSVKNTLAITVSKTALVSLKIAYERYDQDNEGKIDFIDILKVVNMYNASNSYIITDMDDMEVTVSGADLSQSQLHYDGSTYTLYYGGNSLVIKNVSIQ